MKKPWNLLKTALIASALFALLLSGIYPLLIYGIGDLFFKEKAHGSLIRDKNTHKILGSKWIGQNFQGPAYFHPRPSYAGVKGYDGMNSSGSNLGPTSLLLIETIRQRCLDFRKENGITDSILIPIDAVTASASGLDPHISVENALLQSKRIAEARHLDINIVQNLIEDYTQPKEFGILGQSRVNVLLLNQALDERASYL